MAARLDSLRTEQAKIQQQLARTRLSLHREIVKSRVSAGLTYLVSPGEKKFLELSPNSIPSSQPEEVGADILAYTSRGKLGVQRKHVPDDFIASFEDGRLSKELPALRESVTFPVLLLEGDFIYNKMDLLMVGGRESRYTKTQVRNILRSIRYVQGIDVERSADIEDTVAVVNELVGWIEAEKHDSLYSRPSIRSEWGVASRVERQLHFLQGFPGVGVNTARKILDRFGSLGRVVKLVPTDAELMEVDGLGKSRISKIKEVLE